VRLGLPGWSIILGLGLGVGLVVVLEVDWGGDRILPAQMLCVASQILLSFQGRGGELVGLWCEVARWCEFSGDGVWIIVFVVGKSIEKIVECYAALDIMLCTADIRNE